MGACDSHYCADDPSPHHCVCVCCHPLQAIEGYRETEKAHWSAENMAVIQRLKRVASHVVENRQLSVLEEVHILDLAKDG